MTRGFSSILRALHRDERGTGVVELALVAPVLALLTVGIIDLSKGVTRRAELHQAVHRTLEKAAAQNFTAPVLTGKPSYNFLKAEVVEAAGGEAAGITEDDVKVIAWLECDGEEIATSDEAEYYQPCPALDSPPPECSLPNPPDTVKCTAIQARYLQVRVDGSFKPSFSWLLPTEADGTFSLFAEAAVRIQ